MGEPVIGLDGDDTLWHSESHFVTTTARIVELLSPWVQGESAEAHMLEVERRNLATFGYGVKAFTLSMIETAIEVSDAQVPVGSIASILGWARELMDHPVELLEGVTDTVEGLAQDHRLLLVTKGDLLHQESKVARSGLADHFEGIHIVSEKDEATYRRVLAAHAVDPADFVMVGNSVRSEVLPVLAMGGRAVHIPYHVLWALEHVDGEPPAGVPRLERIAELPALLEHWPPP